MSNLSYNIFALNSEANNNDTSRHGSIVMEYFSTTVNLNGSGIGSVTVQSRLKNVIGVITCGSTNGDANTRTEPVAYVTPGIVNNGQVTVKFVSIASAAATDRRVSFLLLGTEKLPTVLSNSPN